MSASSSARRLALAALVAVSASSLSAQTAAAPTRAWDLTITEGSLNPTGELRTSIQKAKQTTARLSWSVRPKLALTGTFGWARSRDIALASAPKLDVFTSDIGLELRAAPANITRKLSVRPFGGIGAGVRSYNYRSLDVDATHNPAAYISAGGEFGLGRAGLRIEVRDYTSGFKPLSGIGASSTRNDVVVMAGIRVAPRAAKTK